MVDINKNRNIPDNTSNIKAEKSLAISNLLPDSIIIQDKPANPDPQAIVSWARQV